MESWNASNCSRRWWSLSLAVECTRHRHRHLRRVSDHYRCDAAQCRPGDPAASYVFSSPNNGRHVHLVLAVVCRSFRSCRSWCCLKLWEKCERVKKRDEWDLDAGERQSWLTNWVVVDAPHLVGSSRESQRCLIVRFRVKWSEHHSMTDESCFPF